MRRFVTLAAAGIGLCVCAPALLADPAPEQGQVRKDQREGNVQSLRQIERKVLPKMKQMQYLGPEYDPAAMAYRLKFIGKGRVYFVDVDARSGKIIAFSK